MCDVPTMASTGMQIGGSVLGFSGQRQQAKEQARFQAEQYRQISTIAKDNYVRGIGAIQERTSQELAATGQAALQNQNQLRASASQASTALGERGIAGNSVNALLDEFERQEVSDNYTLALNRYWSQRQAADEMRGLEAQTKSAIASATPQPINGPSPLAMALQIGTTAIDGFDTYQRRNMKGVYNKNED